MTSPSPADELVERLLSELKDIRASAQLRLTRLIEADDKIESLSAELAEARVERDEAKRRLFPYADVTEICGYSTTGIYLIGDRKSIKAAEKAFHYSAQIDEYRTAFDERIKAAEASVTALSAEVERLRGALLRHGAHARNCERPRGPECDCGWDELSAALANEETGRCK